MRICTWLTLATALAACGGDEFTETSGGTGGAGASGGASAGGTGGSGGTSQSGTGGTAGERMDGGVDGAAGGKAGAAGTANGGTGGTSGTGGTGGTSGTGGQQDAGPPPACQGTPFSTNPAMPRADQSFTLGMTIVGGSDYVCAHLVASCAPLGEISLPFNCNASGCTGGGMVSCQAGTATAIFYKRRKNPNDPCCDGNPSTTCAFAGDIEVSSPGTVVAQCTFVVSP